MHSSSGAAGGARIVSVCTALSYLGCRYSITRICSAIMVAHCSELLRVVRSVNGIPRRARVSNGRRSTCRVGSLFLRPKFQRYLQDSLRKRFTNAYNWFGRLKEATKLAVNDILESCRESLKETEKKQEADDQVVEHSEEECVSGHKRHQPTPPPLTRPSEYLRSCCPLCFGGQFPDPQHQLPFVLCQILIVVL